MPVRHLCSCAYMSQPACNEAGWALRLGAIWHSQPADMPTHTNFQTKMNELYMSKPACKHVTLHAYTACKRVTLTCPYRRFFLFLLLRTLEYARAKLRGSHKQKPKAWAQGRLQAAHQKGGQSGRWRRARVRSLSTL